jgi:hypothetical protein
MGFVPSIYTMVHEILEHGKLLGGRWSTLVKHVLSQAKE